jgi:hypothetical protein
MIRSVCTACPGYQQVAEQADLRNEWYPLFVTPLGEYLRFRTNERDPWSRRNSSKLQIAHQPVEFIVIDLGSQIARQIGNIRREGCRLREGQPATHRPLTVNESPLQVLTYEIVNIPP